MNYWITAVESLILGGLGGWGTVQALSKHLGDRWLESLKARYSRELEEFKDELERQRKKVQAGIDNSVFVTRAQFETEFQAMKDLFKALSDVFLGLNGLRPMSAILDPTAGTVTQREEKLFERLNELQKSYNQLVTTAEMLRPFYSSSLYPIVEECLRAVHDEIIDIKTTNDEALSLQGLQKGEKSRDRYSAAYTEAGRVIRERVESFAVIPAD